ncbi:ZZ-type zinc finger-containing protein 3 [Phymastichus coffea]|uniref:ZZ-type zinc finger-containing protein 3 n=1 Tax=Phymastichus coffea TaxID=108790 RepID=UPI00273C0BCF|nr:ZZ-type zinc finger-containing protein 3 [Phymastichus coffea]
MESSEKIVVDEMDENNISQAQIFNYLESSTPTSQVPTLNGFVNNSKEPQPSTSKNHLLESALSDIPSEVLTGCGPEEAFRSDYKAAIFPRSRPPDAPHVERTPSIFHEEETIDPEDNFYFESDHLALKNNDDYRNMLKTIVILQAQRTQAIKDVDTLLMAKKEALKDPIGYVNKIQTGTLPEYPGPQVIAEIPQIDWSKYNVAQPDANMRPQTRHAKSAPSTSNTKQDDDSEKRLVRGRVYSEGKPETFNKPWTEEEQQRLEELLYKYPPEEVEMKRWTKIANALGNRTPKQVSSRVQKYFIKLMKRGLPVPGREPRMKSDGRCRAHRHKPSFRKSTFFPYEQLLDEITKKPVKEPFDEDSTSSIPNMDTDTELSQVGSLQEFKEDKIINSADTIGTHHGYKCYICGEEPIKGHRFHCEDCVEVDLCSHCSLAQHQVEEPLHPCTHQLTRIEPPTQCSNGYDSDYLPNNFASTNYMDPNFCPGNISNTLQKNMSNIEM